MLDFKFIISNKNILGAIGFMALILVANVNLALADNMSSSNYQIQSDSMNFGGNRATSASYVSEDTLGEIATGVSTSSNYVMNAGYQQMQVTYIAMTQASNVVLAPAIGGISGGIANGQTTFAVTTDNPAGYSATITASSSPALVSATDSFADYVPAGANPDFSFTNSASASSFGFSPEGADITNRFKNDGASCNAGSNTANGCWDGLSTSPKTFLSRANGNHPNGVVTTLKFRAVSGANHVQQNGVYTATTTITVIPN